MAHLSIAVGEILFTFAPVNENMSGERELSERDLASFVKRVAGDGEMSAQERLFVSIIHSVYDTLYKENVEPSVTAEQAEYIFSQFPLGPSEEIDFGEGAPVGVELEDEKVQKIHDWNDMGLSYAAIATLVGDKYGIEIDKSTIYRYCQDRETETAEAD